MACERSMPSGAMVLVTLVALLFTLEIMGLPAWYNKQWAIPVAMGR